MLILNDITNANRCALLTGPVRQCVTTSNRGRGGRFFSSKRNAFVLYESSNEFNCLTLLDVWEDVVAFGPQPCRVDYTLGNKKRWTYPDFAVRLLDGCVELWEVKPDDGVPTQTKKAISEACNIKNVSYRVVTRSYLKREPILKNARLLNDFKAASVDASVEKSISKALGHTRVRTLSDLCKATCLKAADLLPAALRGHFAIDLGSDAFPAGAFIRPARSGATSGGFVSHSKSSAVAAEASSTDGNISTCIRPEPPLRSEREQARRCRTPVGHARLRRLPRRQRKGRLRTNYDCLPSLGREPRPRRPFPQQEAAPFRQLVQALAGPSH